MVPGKKNSVKEEQARKSRDEEREREEVNNRERDVDKENKI